MVLLRPTKVVLACPQPREHFDPQADAVYINFTNSPNGDLTTVVAEFEEILGTAQLDFDETKRLVGIEILNASGVLPLDMLESLKNGK